MKNIMRLQKKHNGIMSIENDINEVVKYSEVRN